MQCPLREKCIIFSAEPETFSMSLARYRAKRNFEATPEPAADEPGGGSEALFCVQRHDARRLHYDLRLEMNGALASWAVPYGPTLDPTVKRLAVKVEDHPLSYAKFEGTIPEGNYGAGTVLLWDLGTWAPLGDVSIEKQLERGDLKFTLHGQKLHGTFGLVRMKTRSKQEEWLLIKKKDGEESADWKIEDYPQSVLTPEPFPEVIRPMLAQIVKEPPTGDGWMFEIKWDGVRALAHIADGRYIIRSRKGEDITKQYPELAELAKHVKAKTAVLDGEIVVPDEEGRPRFELIQPRIMARGEHAIARMAANAPARYVAFDLLYCNGRDLRNLPLRTRKRELSGVVQPYELLQVSQDFRVDGKNLLQAARAQGLEGIMAKRAESRYVSSRADDWRKIKTGNEDDFLICGYTKGERDHFGALVLGERDGDGFRYAGNVGTGFDQKTMATISRAMEPLRQPKSPFTRVPKLPQEVVWLKPRLVCAVRYLERTSEGRLRAPVYIGMREEEEPQQKFTHTDKVMFPADGITKRDLLDYYDAVSKWLLPHLRDRPLSMLRFPDGIGKKGFFQKNLTGHLPDWLRRENIPTSEEPATMMPIGGAKTDLLYLVNLGCIDQNPWMSRWPNLETPDFVLIDLDAKDATFENIIEAALLVKKLLEQIGLTGYPKTTGGDGMHVYIPVATGYAYEHTRAFAELIARYLAHKHPDTFTMPRAVAARQKGRVYFDWVQNGHGKTISAPYVVRPKPGAPVATPLHWDEVKVGLDRHQFHLRNAVARFEKVGDLFAPVLDSKQQLEKALERLQRLVKG
jgi:bifunctional non-homologous end joining protein LigD